MQTCEHHFFINTKHLKEKIIFKQPDCRCGYIDALYFQNNNNEGDFDVAENLSNMRNL